MGVCHLLTPSRARTLMKFFLYDTGANCMVLPSGPGFKGSPIKCTLPGETVVEGQVIQVLSMKNNDAKVKVVALPGAAPIMPNCQWLF
eukprot:1959167-Amphidinium_carterae.3